jgi:outer membrane protein OmpA-like peptidoglycan-associated protein
MENLNGSDSLLLGAGAGFLLTPNLGLNLEARLAPALEKAVLEDPDAAAAARGTNSPAEFLGAIRGRTDGGFHWTAGGAAGLSHGAGAAEFRAFAGVGYGRIQGAGSDLDMDGVLDAADRCPDQREVQNGYDDTDGCPDLLGNLQVLVRLNGRIQEGADVAVVGQSDMKRVESSAEPVFVTIIPGDYTVKAALPGYAAQVQMTVQEGDNKVVLDLQAATPAMVAITVVDLQDQPILNAGISFAGEGAPSTGMALKGTNRQELSLPPGTYSMFVKAKGYAMYRVELSLKPGDAKEVVAVLGGERVKVTKVSIDILERVYFETDKSIIKTESFSLLDEVATAILANPDIRLIEVAGHTDAEGDDSYNLQLSQARSEAVVAYLVERGVEAARLTAKGYGEAQPVADNNTVDGRAANRRVEFRILKRQ